MPSCRITNYTSQPLNVALKHLCALHFENEVGPGQTIKLKPGRVWFTLEVLVDNKDNRYSAAQSAAAIAIISLACVGAATAAVPAIAAAGGATAIGGSIGTGIGTIGTSIGTIGTTIGTTISGLGSTIVAGGVGMVAAGETVVAGVSTALHAGSGFLIAHAGAAGTLAASILPKAVEIVEKEVGEFNNVQKEVVAILSAPNVTEEVRTQGLSLLGRLGVAVAADRAAAAAEEREKAKENEKALNAAPVRAITDGTSGSGSGSDASGPTSKPTLKRMQTSVSTLLHKVTTEAKEAKENRLERKASKKEAKAAKEAASWEVVDFDVSSEPTMLSSKEKLRIHGLYMNERRHFEVREKEGKLVLMDANTREVVVG